MMVDTSGSSLYARHDAETFRVAEELMMLSSCVPTVEKLQTGSPSNISGFFERTVKEECMSPTPVRARGGATTTHRKHRQTTHGASTRGQKNQTHGTGKKTKERINIKVEAPVSSRSSDDKNILNSQCDVSHSILLQEHRSRCRRARRRWNIARNSKMREYVARFQVQGVPLVQHLEALARPWTVN